MADKNEIIVESTKEFTPDDRKKLNGYCRTINRCLDNISNNILKMGAALYSIQQEGLFAIDGYHDIYTFAKKEFGISKTTCYNYIGLVEVFGVESKYSPTQMIEMLPYVRKGGDISEIKPEMSTREIRRFIKDQSKISSPGAGTDSEVPANTPAAKPQRFVFTVTEDLFKAPEDSINAFFAELRISVINAFMANGSNEINIVIG